MTTHSLKIDAIIVIPKKPSQHITTLVDHLMTTNNTYSSIP